MATLLHLVFGGELVDPSRNEFKNIDNIDIVGMFPNYESAHKAWEARSHATVDNAHTRYFIAHLHRLRDEENEASAEDEAAEGQT